MNETTTDKSMLMISEKGLPSDEKKRIVRGLESILTQITAEDKKYIVDIQKGWFNQPL